MANPKKRSGPVTADAVVDAALALIDAEGLDALTMRRLAHDLGVEPVTIYRQLPNKEAILAGVAERLWSEMRPADAPARAGGPAAAVGPATAGEPATAGQPDWCAELRAMWLGLHQLMQDHPNVIPIIARGGAYSATAGSGTAAMVGVFRRAGLTPGQAAELLHIIGACVVGFGFATLWSRDVPTGPQAETPPTPDELAPYLEAIAYWDPKHFETALDIILDAYGEASGESNRSAVAAE